jgi:hypothetical protein
MSRIRLKLIIALTIAALIPLVWTLVPSQAPTLTAQQKSLDGVLDLPKPPSATLKPSPTVDDLIEQIESLRKQKAALEAKEVETKKQLEELLNTQQERLKKLGLAKPTPLPVYDAPLPNYPVPQNPTAVPIPGVSALFPPKPDVR